MHSRSDYALDLELLFIQKKIRSFKLAEARFAPSSLCLDNKPLDVRSTWWTYWQAGALIQSPRRGPSDTRPPQRSWLISTLPSAAQPWSSSWEVVFTQLSTVVCVLHRVWAFPLPFDSVGHCCTCVCRGSRAFSQHPRWCNFPWAAAPRSATPSLSASRDGEGEGQGPLMR